MCTRVDHPRLTFMNFTWGHLGTFWPGDVLTGKQSSELLAIEGKTKNHAKWKFSYASGYGNEDRTNCSGDTRRSIGSIYTLTRPMILSIYILMILCESGGVVAISGRGSLVHPKWQSPRIAFFYFISFYSVMVKVSVWVPCRWVHQPFPI